MILNKRYHSNILINNANSYYHHMINFDIYIFNLDYKYKIISERNELLHLMSVFDSIAKINKITQFVIKDINFMYATKSFNL